MNPHVTVPTRRQVIREEVRAYAPLAFAAILAWWGGSALMAAGRMEPPPRATAPVIAAATSTPAPITPTALPSASATRWSDPDPEAGMQVMVMVTHTPTPRAAVLPTKIPRDAVPMCGMGSVNGLPCKQPLPPVLVPTPTPYPMCATYVPGDICIENPNREDGFATPQPAATPIWEGRGN